MRRERSLLSLSLVLYVGALMLESLIICNTSYASEISGDWATQGNAAHVRIERCTAVQDQFCGVVTWLWEPIDSHGEPIRDARNPDMRLRDRPLMGLTLLTDLRQGDREQLIDGRIYNPENGRTYRASLRLRKPDVLEVQGCLLFVCDTQIWRRVHSVCRSAMELQP